MTEHDYIVELVSASKIYRRGSQEVVALHEVNLRIKRGELVVILGPSGCGKSTLLNMIGGLDVPTSGRLIADGFELGSKDDLSVTDYRRTKIGFVFQFFNLVPTLSARENVQLAAELVPDPRDVDQVLEEVGLRERSDHFPSELSGGEQQRVAIARGLVKNPPILLCDEPTGELDFETGRKILTLLHKINHEQNQTVLIVTHNSAIAQIADRVVKLQSGRIVMDQINPDPIGADTLEW